MDTLILKRKRGTSSGGHNAYILGGGSSGRGARLRRCAGTHTGTIAHEWGCGGWRQHYLQYVERAEQFVRLRSRGAESERAMHAVNANAHDERACGVAAMAYIRNEVVETMKLEDKLVQLVRINVVAGFNGSACGGQSI